MISGDEELLELQREFEKSKPSVKIIKKSEKKSIFAQRQNFALPSKIDSNTELFGTVLSNIKERHADDSNAPVLKHPSGFPIAQHRSIQPLKMHSGQETGNEIHDANMKYLGGMSAEQIKEAQEEIYATFSKETIEIIKKNAAKKYGNKEKESSGDELETNNVSKPVDEGLMKMDEEKKLEWTKEIPMAVQDQMRLDFHGCILDSGVEYGSISGLYHHGDQPDRAGYTIEELVHLTKSTFPSQRAFSLQIISLIVEKIYSQSYSPQNCKDITAKLKKENIALVSRIGMDAKHETVYCMAINLLATILGYHNNGRAMNEHLLMLSLYSSKTVLNLETTISMELDSQIGFKKKRNGEKVEPIELENDMETILKLLQSDIILGLLLSNITTRVRYLLRIVSSDEHKLQLIYILTCIAQHSPSSAEDILATEDLVDTLSDILFNPTWPAVEGLRLDIIFNALNLIGILCRSSYESAVAITRSTLVSRIVRFISIYHLEKAHLDIVKAVFTIFDTLFIYGLSASIIDSYRALFLDFAEKISTIFPMDSDGNISENSAVIESFATFLRMLKTSLEKFRAQLDAGGINDAYVPFVELVLRTLKTSGIKFQVIID
ncbi:RNA polymerase II associated protein 1 [Boothiomyces macroporosus]|uniref:RNA polymerase II associated protein 1 n=1 Tax=Boothiomyces macroporosus TaxID=261099 RepID=A0AAD5UQJ2_9FUNG|nr:RNA polymerase II associated protein 1 [Boothiomyces macroporosus]